MRDLWINSFVCDSGLLFLIGETGKVAKGYTLQLIKKIPVVYVFWNHMDYWAMTDVALDCFHLTTNFVDHNGSLG